MVVELRPESLQTNGEFCAEGSGESFVAACYFLAHDRTDLVEIFLGHVGRRLFAVSHTSRERVCAIMTVAFPRSRVFLCSLASKRWNCVRFVSTRLSRPRIWISSKMKSGRRVRCTRWERPNCWPIPRAKSASRAASKCRWRRSATAVWAAVRIQGRFEVQMEAECDRCLGRARFPLDTSFDLFYRPASFIAREEEVEIDEGEVQLGFYQGGGMELEDLLREQILLVMPMQRVCNEDCRGICPTCGKNRNETPCDCKDERAGNRWAALQGLKDLKTL